MEKVILLTSSEIFLKKGNRNQLFNRLRDNIQNKLNSFGEIKISVSHVTILIRNFQNEDEKEIKEKLQYIPGITYIYSGFRWKKKIVIDEVFKDFFETFTPSKVENTFRVDVKIEGEDQSPYKKMDILNQFAGLVSENFSQTVNLDNPDIGYIIRIASAGSFILVKKENGIAGFPQGNSKDNVVSLLSGGCDSVLATMLALKRGLKVTTISFYSNDNPEYKKKIKKIVREMDSLFGLNNSIFINMDRIIRELRHIKEKNYQLIIIKSIFLKIAKQISTSNNCHAIITGDAINQVSSQTLLSMSTIQDNLDFLVIRPLITRDKESINDELRNYSRKLFDLANSKSDDICSKYTPKNPKILPTKEKLSEIWGKQLIIEDVINYVILNDIEMIRMKEDENE